MDHYLSNKMNYLKIKHNLTKTFIDSKPMVGGKPKRVGKKSGKRIIMMTSENNQNDEAVKQKIDEIVRQDMKDLKTIGLPDLRGLVLRLYERNGEKSIDPIVFRTPHILKYLDSLDTQDCKNGVCVFNADSFKLMDYYDNEYGQKLVEDLEVDFGTKDQVLRLAFRDNYEKGITESFEIQQPIKLMDLLKKIFDHFDKVHLVGYPDNGGIDAIKYDKKHDMYMIHTWS